MVSISISNRYACCRLVVIFFIIGMVSLPNPLQQTLYNRCRRQILSGLLCLFSFLGLGPIYNEVQTWASNLVRFLIYRVLVILFRICFVFNCCLSLNVMFVSFRIVPCFSFVSNIVYLFYFVRVIFQM